MNGLVGMMELLLTSQLNHEQERYADTVRRSTESLMSMLNDRDGDLRLLVVEDNPLNQEVSQAFLAILNCEADIVSDGQEALDALEKQNYAAILMDCQMPGMDGYTASRLIREKEAGCSRIPIIAVTANAMAEDQERIFESGMDDVLTKPFELKELKETLVRWVHLDAEDSGSSA